MRAGVTAFQPMQHEAQGVEVEILFAQKAVSVGEKEQGAVCACGRGSP
jgi:hypothetical protein